MRFQFLDSGDARKARAAFERVSHLGQLRGRANGQDFHAAVVEISRESPDPRFVRHALHEKAEAHALDGPGDKIAPGLFLVGHEP